MEGGGGREPRGIARDDYPDSLDWPVANREVISLGLAWLAALIETEIARLRASAPAERHHSDSAMSDLAADWLLRDLKGGGDPATDTKGRAAEHGGAATAQRAYQARRTEMLSARQPAAIDLLSRSFGLSAFEEDVLLLALAPRLEAGFQALFGYLHDRLSLMHPTPHSVHNLFAGARGEAAVRHLAWQRLTPTAPLRRHCLIRLDSDLVSEGAAALNAITLDERIADYLLGVNRIDGRLSECLRTVAQVQLPKARATEIAELAHRLPQHLHAVFVGPEGSGRRAAAAALAHAQGLGLTELVPERWLEALRAGPSNHADRHGLALLAREAVLTRQVFLVDAGRRGEGEPSLAWRFAEDALDVPEAPLFVVAEERPRTSAEVLVRRLPGLSDGERGEVWCAALGKDGNLPRSIEAIAAQFRIGPQTIAGLASSIKRQAAINQRRVQVEDLWQACREACGPAIAGLAERIEPRFSWDDLVLPDKVKGDLRALAGQVPGRPEVLGRWGFSRRWGESGASALFAGASGTGKSMAAEVIAGALDLDLYRIELSGVVSKYIGETEKNLQRIFEAAEASGAVLLFDEADAIFGKRSEVKDAHDRYANIEVSYLLQAMERYRGLAILSTNMKSNIDQAFFRRLSYVIDFPRPDQQAREQIWRLAIPQETPTQGLDLPRLAKMDLAGGSIVRIALNAAYLAAGADKKLSMDDIFQAAAAEHRKVDKEFRAP
jgi:hypothetical protein